MILKIQTLQYVTHQKNINSFQTKSGIYAKAESLRLNLKAKASIWLVSRHLRSLNTVNERLLYQKHVYRKSNLWMF
jgi:hypothetical protein